MRRNRKGPSNLKRSGARISFSSEALLQQAVAGLLVRMPDITDVQILQGALETGKDIVFNIRGGFDEQIPCACVVKNTKITGSVSRSGGARTIYFQTEQAFDSEYTNADGENTVVERVYVVTPYDLPSATIASISGKLKERAGRVKFIGGSKLFDLFKRYWPDYLADEASLIEKHLTHIRDLLTEDDPLQSLAFEYSLGSVSSRLTSVYVTQGFHREIRTYQLGPVLTSSLLSFQVLDDKLDKDTILEMRKALTRYDKALEYLNEWELCPPTYDRNELAESSRAFFQTLLGEWEKTVTRAPNESWQSLFFKRIKLPAADSLKKPMQDLLTQRHNCLSLLKEKLKQLDQTVTSCSFHDITALSDDNFLSGSYLNECARLAPEGVFLYSNKSIKLSFPKDILEQWGKALLIVGPPGFGKTSFCKWNALLDAERFTLGESNVLPIYVPLNKFSRTKTTSFERTFLLGLGQSALIPQSESSVQPRLRLYLDGLDEIASSEHRRAVVSLARSGTEKYPDSQLVITSRDYVSGTWLNWVPRIFLSEFNDSDVLDLVDKWLGSNTEVNNQFQSQLKRLPTLHHLLRTPLLATLVIMVFKQTGRLPESKSRLYEVVIDLLSGGWDMAKGILRGSKYGQKLKIIILSSLAGKLHTFRRREFNDDDINAAIESSLRLNISDREILRDELIVDGLIGQSGGVLYFSHLSFQEFLAAKVFMGSPRPTRSEHALELYLSGDDWWREVLKFYISLSSSPNVATSWLNDQLQRIKKDSISVPHVLELYGSVVESFPDFPLKELARSMSGIVGYEKASGFLEDVRRKIFEPAYSDEVTYEYESTDPANSDLPKDS